MDLNINLIIIDTFTFKKQLVQAIKNWTFTRFIKGGAEKKTKTFDLICLYQHWEVIWTLCFIVFCTVLIKIPLHRVEKTTKQTQTGIFLKDVIILILKILIFKNLLQFILTKVLAIFELRILRSVVECLLTELRSKAEYLD